METKRNKILCAQKLTSCSRLKRFASRLLFFAVAFIVLGAPGELVGVTRDGIELTYLGLSSRGDGGAFWGTQNMITYVPGDGANAAMYNPRSDAAREFARSIYKMHHSMDDVVFEERLIARQLSAETVVISVGHGTGPDGYLSNVYADDLADAIVEHQRLYPNGRRFFFTHCHAGGSTLANSGLAGDIPVVMSRVASERPLTALGVVGEYKQIGAMIGLERDQGIRAWLFRSGGSLGRTGLLSDRTIGNLGPKIGMGLGYRIKAAVSGQSVMGAQAAEVGLARGLIGKVAIPIAVLAETENLATRYSNYAGNGMAWYVDDVLGGTPGPDEPGRALVQAPLLGAGAAIIFAGSAARAGGEVLVYEPMIQPPLDLFRSVPEFISMEEKIDPGNPAKYQRQLSSMSAPARRTTERVTSAGTGIGDMVRNFLFTGNPFHSWGWGW